VKNQNPTYQQYNIMGFTDFFRSKIEMNEDDRNRLPGSETLMKNHTHLQPIAGNATWLNEFKPIY
jgi:hypothetical protein